MRILIVDNHIDADSWGAGDLRRLARLAPGATIHVRRAPQGDLPPDPRAYDRIIVSGSKTSALEDAPWIEALHEFIRRTLDCGRPYLGVCYGHQALIRAIGGKDTCRRAAEAEYGWTRIELLERAPLLRDLPDSFYTFSAHFEEVASLPPGLRRLARSADCEIQACAMDGRPVYGIQFHPEKDAESAKKTLADRRKKGTPKRLLHPDGTDRLYDASIGEKLFLNFFGL